MPGRRTATVSGAELTARVVALAEELGLDGRTNVVVGRRLWGAIRKTDVVVTDPTTRRTLGLECKCQRQKGSAEEKIPATVDDLSAWPIRGLIVTDGPGFSANIRHFLASTGKAVEFDDLRTWLKLYFGLPD